ncbi:hypothetical protein ACFL3F_02150 [Planctomycetota bacterium]
MTNENLALEYWDWVKKLAEWHFCAENEGRQVRLHWPHTEEFRGLEKRFFRVLREWNAPYTVISTARHLHRYWNQIGGTFQRSLFIIDRISGIQCDYPPYLPYLVCFSMAWGEEGDYSSNAYYSRLNDLLHPNNEDHIGTPQFKKIDILWKSLAVWANTTKGGELGLFTAYSSGYYEHVGYPLSQVVLSPLERKMLHAAFQREGWTPDMSIDDDDINYLILKFKDQLNYRAQTSINNKVSTYLHALYEEIRIELASFRPLPRQFNQYRQSQSNELSICPIRLRLDCRIGLHGIERWIFKSCKDVENFTEINHPPYIIRPGQRGILWQQSKKRDTNDPIEFTDFDFLGKEIRITGRNEIFRWPLRRVRFFSPSRLRDGWFLEQEIIPPTGPIVVLHSSEDRELLNKLEHKVLAGNIPQGCTLVQTDDVQTLFKLFPNQRPRTKYLDPIILTGGIKLSPYDDTYFSYALPDILLSPNWEIESSTPGVSLELSGEDNLWKVKASGGLKTTEIVFHASSDKTFRRTKKIGVTCHPPIPPAQSNETPNSIEHGNLNNDNNISIQEPYTSYSEVLGNASNQLVESPLLHLWEIISLRQQLPYNKFRNIALQLFNSRHFKPQYLAYSISSLGHIHIETSPTNHRWYAIKVPTTSLCRLPWNKVQNNITYVQAILKGSLNWLCLTRVLRKLPNDVRCDCLDQCIPLAPPRIRFYSDNVNSLKKVANKLRATWRDFEYPQALFSIDDFRKTLLDWQWYDGIISPENNVSFYSPYHLKSYKFNSHRLDRLKQITGNFVVAEQSQPYGLSDYYLLDLQNDKRSLIPKNQLPWARWLSYTTTAYKFYESLHRSRSDFNKGIRIAIPYDPKDGSLIFPASLKPPAQIDRLLCSCSGLFPNISDWNKACSKPDGLDYSNIRDYNSPLFFPINGKVHVYKYIPEAIARLVASLLEVELQSVTLNDEREQ